jgi:hypothetical protein
MAVIPHGITSGSIDDQEAAEFFKGFMRFSPISQPY